MRGVPKCIRSGQRSGVYRPGPSSAGTKQLRIETLYIAPGSPWENGYAESFHSRLGDEFFGGLERVREFGGGEEADRCLERRLQPSPTAQFPGVRDPGGIRGPLCCFRSGYALTPAAQRNYPTRTFITPVQKIKASQTRVDEEFSIVTPHRSANEMARPHSHQD